MLFFLTLTISCEKFLEVDFPENELTGSAVFEEDATALAALSTLYALLRDDVLLNGTSSGLSVCMGTYTDELDYYGIPGQPLDSYYRHSVQASDIYTANFWNNSYKVIYIANSLLEGIQNNDKLSPEVVQQIKGESLFIRGLVHFYLAQLFGDIPYIIRTDYIENTDISKLKENDVYEGVIKDLNNAESYLEENYLTNERIRPNKSVVTALLAKVYLVKGDWESASLQSGKLISNTNLFPWENDLEKIFLKGSSTAIWQLKPKLQGENTLEAGSFLFSTPPPPSVALSNHLLDSFETGDLRRSLWIRSVSDETGTWYQAYKYRERANTGSSLEYSVIFRLAEQYLIRAECRVHLGDLEGAREDLNKVRFRAGLSPELSDNPENLIQAILHERQVELFTELGARWFDLKRSGKAGEILSSIKPGWRPTDILLPIPEKELQLNPNLLPQNPGY